MTWAAEGPPNVSRARGVNRDRRAFGVAKVRPPMRQLMPVKVPQPWIPMVLRALTTMADMRAAVGVGSSARTCWPESSSRRLGKSGGQTGHRRPGRAALVQPGLGRVARRWMRIEQPKRCPS